MPSIAPKPSLIYRPGLRSLPAGVERYVVKGAGSVVLAVQAGDIVRLADMEGGQVCEIGFCDATGRFDTSALAFRADGRGEGLKAALAQDNEPAIRSLAAR